MFEPTRGIDDDYDSACDLVSEIKEDLDDYKNKMSTMMYPKHIAKTQWKYANTKDDSKDKYLIELPVSVEVPNDFFVKGKRCVFLICFQIWLCSVFRNQFSYDFSFLFH